MAVPRTRLSPEASRDAAIDAARAILFDEGPQAVTLKAVAARIGRTHANLLHHFGSAAGLQKALIGDVARRTTAEIAEAVKRARAGERDPRAIVDLTFDAFARAAGPLASWMLLSGNRDALDPILEAIHALVEELSEGHQGGRSLGEQTLQLVLLALGDALLGEAMAGALGLPRDKARELAATTLKSGS
jgi:AcrR family transcriptional regulator